MNGISGNKMVRHLGRVCGDYRPITADVFLTNFCNNRCPYCTYGRWETDGGARQMSFEDFVRYAERLRELGVEGIILTGGGEPTLCRDFGAITRWMEERGIHYGLNTNFNNRTYCKPDYIKVSLDGWDEESYEKARGVKRYREVVENVRAYAEWRKENSPRTTLGVQMVCTGADDVRRFYAANRDLDVDYFSIRPVESTGGTYYAGKQREADEVVAAVRELRAADERVVLNFKWEMLGQTFGECSAQWAQIAVDERGDVMYCCHKPYQIIGNIMDDDILQKKAAAVTDMSMCDVPCRMTAPNDFVRRAETKVRDEVFI